MDDLRRVRRLLRRPDDEPRLHRLRRPVGVRHRRRARRSRSRRPGTRSGCAATSPGRSRSTASTSPATDRRPRGRRRRLQRRVGRPWFLIGSSSVWNGIAMGAIDIGKRQTTRKRHVDVGLRVADYPTIQDYIGEAVMDTNAARLFVFSVAQAMDNVTEHNTIQLPPASSRARTSCTGRGRSSSSRPRTPPTWSTRCSTRAAAPATSATWSSSATCATPRPAG